jgi:hypothetical protein
VIVVFVVLAALFVIAIGLVAVGGVTGRLAQQERRSVFQMEQAVHFVADGLPESTTAELSYDDVRRILGWHLDYLEEKGVAGETDDVLDHLPSGPIVTADDEGVAYVLGKSTEAGLDVDDSHVVEVIEGELAYLRAIGAIGAEVPSPVDPDA